MAYDIPASQKTARAGYYYHFKHDSDGREQLRLLHLRRRPSHEENCRSEDAFMQVYRPLYEEAYATGTAGFSICAQLHMFFDPADWKGKQVPRFTKISRPDVIVQLAAIKARMYPSP